MKKQSYNTTGNGKEAAMMSARELAGMAVKLAHEADPARFFGPRSNPRLKSLPSLVVAGLSAKAANYLADNLGVPVEEFTAKYARISKQSVVSRRNSGKLNMDESDRVMRYAVLLDHTMDMMEGDQEAAKDWLKSPQALLDNKTPLEYARTEAGVSEVHQLIGRQLFLRG